MHAGFPSASRERARSIAATNRGSARIFARTASWGGLAPSDLLFVGSGSSDWLISFAISSISLLQGPASAQDMPRLKTSPAIGRSMRIKRLSLLPLDFGPSVAGTILPGRLSAEAG